MSFPKNDLLRFAGISPHLTYCADLARQLSSSSRSTLDLLKAYFAAHPVEYIQELDAFEEINDVPFSRARKAFICVPAFNEEENLVPLSKQYQEQYSEAGSREAFARDYYEICFVINYPESEDETVSRQRQSKLELALERLLPEKEMNSNIHLLPKRFKSTEGSLGRARKYGIDYVLWRLFKNRCREIDRCVIITNEGDTLAIPKDYIAQYAELFAEGVPRFIQGKIEYPHELTDLCEPLKVFTGIREAVHLGQGLAGDAFPYFDGIMPIGRNFAVSPRVYAQVGGIDPIRRKDTDEDLNFGTDIHVLLGECVKSVCPIPVVTNPRREATIVCDIITGNSVDAKKSYEHFNENPNLYDLTYTDVRSMVRDGIPNTIPSRAVLCKLANQYFQWVLISRYKANLNYCEGFAETINLHRRHHISYWEKERQVCAAFQKHLSKLDPTNRKDIEKHLASEALSWFNQFADQLGLRFECTYDGLQSVLQ